METSKRFTSFCQGHQHQCSSTPRCRLNQVASAAETESRSPLDKSLAEQCLAALLTSESGDTLLRSSSESTADEVMPPPPPEATFPRPPRRKSRLFQEKLQEKQQKQQQQPDEHRQQFRGSQQRSPRLVSFLPHEIMDDCYSNAAGAGSHLDEAIDSCCLGHGHSHSHGHAQSQSNSLANGAIRRGLDEVVSELSLLVQESKMAIGMLSNDIDERDRGMQDLRNKQDSSRIMFEDGIAELAERLTKLEEASQETFAGPNESGAGMPRMERIHGLVGYVNEAVSQEVSKHFSLLREGLSEKASECAAASEAALAGAEAAIDVGMEQLSLQVSALRADLNDCKSRVSFLERPQPIPTGGCSATQPVGTIVASMTKVAPPQANMVPWNLGVSSLVAPAQNQHRSTQVINSARQSPARRSPRPSPRASLAQLPTKTAPQTLGLSVSPLSPQSPVHSAQPTQQPLLRTVSVAKEDGSRRSPLPQERRALGLLHQRLSGRVSGIVSVFSQQQGTARPQQTPQQPGQPMQLQQQNRWQTSVRQQPLNLNMATKVPASLVLPLQHVGDCEPGAATPKASGRSTPVPDAESNRRRSIGTGRKGRRHSACLAVGAADAEASSDGETGPILTSRSAASLSNA